MTANAKGNVVNTAFVDGIGVSVSNFSLSVPVFSCNMVFPGFFDVRVHFEKLGFFIKKITVTRSNESRQMNLK